MIKIIPIVKEDKINIFTYRACRYGNKKATHILLDKGATPSVRNSKGVTPLHMACQFNHVDIVKVRINPKKPGGGWGVESTYWSGDRLLFLPPPI